MPPTGGLPLCLCLVNTPWPLLCDTLLVLPLQPTARAQLLVQFIVYSCLGAHMSQGRVEHTGLRSWLNNGNTRLLCS